MVLENANDEGVMQFKIDATGAWLYNASYVMQHDDGGLMIFDPRYGIVAGSKLLFDTNGTTVTPEFLDEYGDIQFDSDGMPKNANFFLDARDGSAYFVVRLALLRAKSVDLPLKKLSCMEVAALTMWRSTALEVEPIAYMQFGQAIPILQMLRSL